MHSNDEQGAVRDSSVFHKRRQTNGIGNRYSKEGRSCRYHNSKSTGKAEYDKRALIDDLGEAIDEIGRDDEVRAVVLTGAGQAFCAGGDFRFSQVRSGELIVKDAEDVEERGPRYLI